jgi:hypothetical protein
VHGVDCCELHQQLQHDRLGRLERRALRDQLLEQFLALRQRSCLGNDRETGRDNRDRPSAHRHRLRNRGPTKAQRVGSARAWWRAVSCNARQAIASLSSSEPRPKRPAHTKQANHFRDCTQPSPWAALNKRGLHLAALANQRLKPRREASAHAGFGSQSRHLPFSRLPSRPSCGDISAPKQRS